MKAVLIEKPFEMKVVEVPTPEIQNPNEVKVKVLCGSICGSDMGIYKGTNSLATYPRIIGHEFGGIVEAVGADVKNVKVGDYVAVDPVRNCGHCYACTHDHHNVCSTLEVTGVHRDGGFCEYVVAPEIACYPVDTNKIPKDLLCFVEPYSIGAEINARLEIGEGDKVLVMGSGPIGLAAMQIAKARGAWVMMTDLMDSRLERAREMGADFVLNTSNTDPKEAVMEQTGGEGIPVVVDTICAPWSFEMSVGLTCPAGRVVVLSTGNKPAALNLAEVTKKELTIVGSRLSNYRFPEVIELMEAGKLNPEKMRTSVYHFTDAVAAMKQAIERQDVECKVALSFV